MNLQNFSRRTFLLTSSAMGLSSCVTCGEGMPPLPVENSSWISDAHSHFFNASDLPVAGFIEYVFIRRFFNDLPEIALSIIDLFVTLVKPFAVTIERERSANLKSISKGSFYEGFSNIEYAQAFKTLVDGEVQKSSFSVSNNFVDEGQFNPEKNLADSYVVLASLLNLYGRDELTTLQNLESKQDLYRELEIDTDLILSIVSSDELDAGKINSFEFDVNTQGTYGIGVFSNNGLENKNGRSGAQNTIGMVRWALLMMKSRCFHVNEYIRKMSSNTSRPSLAINLLVDYDKWLNDEPSEKSSYFDQIEFWHDYSREIRDKLDIRTFAGYDPLKHAYEIQGDTVSYFETQKKMFKQGKFSGFKLYPPMGFQAYGNEGLCFVGDDGIKGAVASDWKDKFPTIELGGALDDALDDFFKFCSGGNPTKLIAPILAHGGNSNDPAKGFGERANPKFWYERITKQNLTSLRLCIGHFTDARAFIAGMKTIERGGSAPQNVWALQDTAKLIKLSIAENADVYADIGYMEELISDTGLEFDLAKDFFEALFQYCKWVKDEDCTRLMYGSDWIMLGIEGNYKEYLATIESAMKRTSWGKIGNEHMMRNFLTNNLRRFLDLDPI